MNERDELEGAARDAAGEICRLYGIPPSLGAAWGLLFATPAPLSLSEIAQRLGVAKSTASTTMKRLEHLRMARRRGRPGDRNDYFEAVTDPMAILRDWLERFIVHELAMSDQMHAHMAEQLARAVDAGAYDDDEAAVLKSRLEQLSTATKVASGFVDQFLGKQNR